jgi:hypothetical protein
VKAFVQQRIRHAQAVRMVKAGEELLKRVGNGEVKGDTKRGLDGSSTLNMSVTNYALAAAARLRAFKPEATFAGLGLESDYDTDDDMPTLLDECVPVWCALRP